MEETYVLTPWGILSATLDDYGIDTSHIRGRVGNHIVEDFMANMVKAGHIAEADSPDDNTQDNAG